jgi:arabinan endo-1,5-alpha-L-arabinosidase
VTRRDLLEGALALTFATGFGRTGRVFAGDAASINERMTGDIVPVHDPCIIKSGGLYHLFCTGSPPDAGLIPHRTSPDLIDWTARAPVFSQLPSWVHEHVPGARGMWAPDISYVDGRYYLYYACSTFGSNRSAIGLATNATLDEHAPDFGWRDEGLVIATEPNDDFNAIDPNHLVDRGGDRWLCLGSFWSGIKLFRLDRKTGKPVDSRKKISLASRPAPQGAPGAIEAPFMIERDGYYYLFVSFDYCCRATASSYYQVVGRARSVRGPFRGRDGKPMTAGFGTLLLEGNRRYHGPGHAAVLHDAGNDYLVYHAYDAEHDGRSTLRISPLVWTDDGWPTVTL